MPSQLRISAAAAALLLLASCFLFPAPDPCSPRIWVPAERLLVVPFQSSTFLGGRRCWVFLPRDYASTDQRYDVIYMLDGQDLFGSASRWRVDQTAEHLIETRQIRPVIIVGIENARGAARTFEYTPWTDSSYALAPSGGGDAFLHAVASTLIPLVNQHFRTITGPAHTYMLGASFGGLIAAYAGYAFDTTFSRVAAMSPSYWWDRGEILTFAYFHGRGGLARFYQDTGTGADDQAPAWLADMSAIAEAQGFTEGRDFLTVIAQGHRHAPQCWGHRLPEALEFLLGPS